MVRVDVDVRDIDSDASEVEQVGFLCIGGFLSFLGRRLGGGEVAGGFGDDFGADTMLVDSL